MQVSGLVVQGNVLIFQLPSNECEEWQNDGLLSALKYDSSFYNHCSFILWGNFRHSQHIFYYLDFKHHPGNLTVHLFKNIHKILQRFHFGIFANELKIITIIYVGLFVRLSLSKLFQFEIYTSSKVDLLDRSALQKST